MKYPKSIIQLVLVLLLSASLPLHASAATIFSYETTVDVQPGGQIYYNYGENGRFFLSSDWEEYDPVCLVTSGQTNSFTKLLDRGFIACPEDGCYFDGFYDPSGKKLTLKETKMDVLRVSVKGIYFFQYFPSKNSSNYKRLTKTAYQNQVKLFLKGLYGTTRYKVMDTVTLYSLPKADARYVARFQKKTRPVIGMDEEVNKSYGNAAFYLASNLSKDLACTFKSSNANVLTVNKTTGYITIKGPGRAKVTCNIKEAEKTKAASFVSVITVKPAKVKNLSAKRTKKTLSVKWNTSSKNSGYEIQVSNNRSFKNIIAKKTVSGGKTNATTVKLKAEVCNNYVRIRAYKTSSGEKIYSSYKVSEIK